MADPANEITTNEEVLTSCQDVQGDLNDVINLTDDKDYVKALEQLDELTEKLEHVHVYLTEKAKT